MIYSGLFEVQLYQNWLNILLKKKIFFCLTNFPFKYHHILLGKIQYNY